MIKNEIIAKISIEAVMANAFTEPLARIRIIPTKIAIAATSNGINAQNIDLEESTGYETNVSVPILM